ncbi:sigma 54-interacting transcriptional regulator [Enterococcus sp. AZ072]|uniref:sigma 54-interacting transcriptional regulator n=1 Tax=unclassified Enterococcus TaxID=2608891 RepID=UPI003D2E37ED
MKVSRINRVEAELDYLTEQAMKDIDFENEVTAEKLAKDLNLSRDNVSRDLNSLVREKKAVKKKGKPVLFFSSKVLERELSIKISTYVVDSFDELYKKDKESHSSDHFSLIGSEGSLKDLIEIAQSAMVYPPHGLPTLIKGETGVGKSLFVEAMYNFGQTEGILSKDSPLIIFNCADYADNPQLLMSQLFGHVKGSYTGAEVEKSGLVEKAENGILFLDEIHRLPKEGQEMLFLLMDKGVYRKMGDSNRYQESNILIIGATTENDDSLLPTFLRRIPLTIELPPLKSRKLSERLELINHIFDLESRRLKKSVVVQKEVIKALLTYECKGNIGQLKSDIQVICAKAFYKSMQLGSECVSVKVSYLASFIYESLFDMNNRKEIDDLLGFFSVNEFKFPQNIGNENVLELSKDEFDSEALYEKVTSLWNEWSSSDLGIEEMNKELNSVLENYTYNKTMEVSMIVQNQILDNQIVGKLRSILKKYFLTMNSKEIEKSCRIIAIHLQHVINHHQERSRNEISFDLEMKESFASFENRGEVEIQAAREILDSLSSAYSVPFTYMDFLYIVNYLSIIQRKKQDKVGLIVIMHGKSTASSMAEFANRLLEIDFIKSVDMDLHDQMQHVLQQTIDKVKEVDEGKGVVILADMGSILNFEKKIRKETNVEVYTVDLVSTPILLELAVKSHGHNMDAEELFHYAEKLKIQYYRNKEKDTSIQKDHLSYFDKVLVRNIDNSLMFLSAIKAYEVLKPILSKLSIRYNFVLDDDILVKFMFHGASMLERCLTEDYLPYKNYQRQFDLYPNFSKELKKEFFKVEQHFGIKIPEEEIASILDIFIVQSDGQLEKHTFNTRDK